MDAKNGVSAHFRQKSRFFSRFGRPEKGFGCSNRTMASRLTPGQSGHVVQRDWASATACAWRICRIRIGPAHAPHSDWAGAAPRGARNAPCSTAFDPGPVAVIRCFGRSRMRAAWQGFSGAVGALISSAQNSKFQQPINSCSEVRFRSPFRPLALGKEVSDP